MLLDGLSQILFSGGSYSVSSYSVGGYSVNNSFCLLYYLYLFCGCFCLLSSLVATTREKRYACENCER